MALASYGSTGENKRRRAEVRTPVPLKIIDKVHYYIVLSRGCTNFSEIIIPPQLVFTFCGRSEKKEEVEDE